MTCPSIPPDDNIAEFDVLDFTFSEETEKRLEARRKLIIDAFLAAGGEPADGRWTQVARLCRLGVTRGGRRWLGTNVDRGILTKDVQGRPKARSEAPNSLDAQEKKRTQDDSLIQRVESWKQALTRDFGVGVSGTSETTAGRGDFQGTTVVRGTRDTRAPGVLNFKVAKHCAPSKASKPPNPAQNSLYPSGQPSTNGHTASAPELSFLPPSFPSHLATSTPQHPSRRKPPLIPRVTFSSPCISPESVRVYDDTMPPYGSQAPEQAPPSSSTNSGSKASAPLPTLTELLVTSKRMKAGQRRTSKDLIAHPTNSSSPRSIHHPGNCSTSNDNTSHDNAGLDGRRKALTTTSIGLHDPGGIEFDPPFTSTQQSALVNSHSSPPDRDLWRGFNSQFDVDRRTTDAIKLLEKDVGIEY